MRFLNKIIFHCADTRTDQNFNISDVKRWHLDRGWSDVGYHYFIKLDGSIQKGRDIGRIGSHCKGHNTGSIGVCFEGGKNPDDSKWDRPTEKQIEAAQITISWLRIRFGELTYHGHYEFSSKSCPNFDICIL